MSIKVNVTGTKELKKYLKDMDKFLQKPTKFYARAGLIGKQDVLRHFQNEEGPSGRWKEIEYRTGKILQDTGRLRQSINFRYDVKNAEVGTNVSYGKYQNPTRTFLWFSKNAVNKMLDTFIDLMGKL
jgi:phage gpG-like protein